MPKNKFYVVTINGKPLKFDRQTYHRVDSLSEATQFATRVVAGYAADHLASYLFTKRVEVVEVLS